MSGWDFDTNTNEGGSAKVEFTKFPVGITKIRVIDEEPYVRWTHFLPQFKRSINCPGKGCPICEIRRQQKANKEPYTYAVGRRLAMNIVNQDTDKLEVMEQGVGFFQDLRDIMQDLEAKGDNLNSAIIKVRRRGTGKDDTSYRLDVEEVKTMTSNELELIKEKIDLAEYFKPHTIEQILRIVQGESWDDVMKQAEVTEDDIELK